LKLSLERREMTKEEILTAKDIAEILQMSVNTVQRKSWRENSGCPLKKIGKRLYVTVSDFDKWFKG